MLAVETISSMGVKSGGTTSCLYNNLYLMPDCKTKVISYSLAEGDSLPGDKLNIEFVNAVPRFGSFAYSKQYRNAVEESGASLFHAHGLWQYSEYITARIARKKNIPYIISPHGMLYPQAMQYSAFKKSLYYRFLLEKDLKHATCLHATCKQELQIIREAGIDTPVAIIPNCIVPSNVFQKIVPYRKRIGYLGRLHSIKNVDRIIEALHSLGALTHDVELLIIGEGDAAYTNYLKELSRTLKLGNTVFTGFLTGHEKTDALDSLTALVVASDSENFGMMVAEALDRKVPVIASKGTPWQDLETEHCGWWVENSVETLAQAIRQALSLTENEWLQMGENGRRLVQEKYSSTVVGKQFSQLYHWAVEGGDIPEFVDKQVKLIPA